MTPFFIKKDQKWDKIFLERRRGLGSFTNYNIKKL